MISVVDNHRLLYKNAVLRAFDYTNRSVSVRFFNADGVDVGETLRTNDSGYLVNAQGTHQITSYFVKQKSIVQVSLDNGSSWSIEYVVDSTIGDSDVNDGGLVNKNGVRVWSANAKFDYTMNYEDLSNQPDLRPWGEGEQCELCKQNEIISVNQFTKVLHLTGTPETVIIGPSLQYRYGQHLTVFNDTTRNVNVYNSLNEFLFRLGPDEARQVFSQFAEMGRDGVLIFRAHTQLSRDDIPKFPDYLFQRNKSQVLVIDAGKDQTVDVTPTGDTVGIATIYVTGTNVGNRVLHILSSNKSYNGLFTIRYASTVDSVLTVYFNDDAQHTYRLYANEESMLCELVNGAVFVNEPNPSGVDLAEYNASNMTMIGTYWSGAANKTLYPRKELNLISLDASQIPQAAAGAVVAWWLPDWVSMSDYKHPIRCRVTRYVGSAVSKPVYVRIYDNQGGITAGFTIANTAAELYFELMFTGLGWSTLVQNVK